MARSLARLKAKTKQHRRKAQTQQLDATRLQAKIAKRKEQIKQLQARLAALQHDDSDSEPDEKGAYVNWSQINVGGLKPNGKPAVEAVFARKTCKHCGARTGKLYCGYDGFASKTYAGYRTWQTLTPQAKQ